MTNDAGSDTETKSNYISVISSGGQCPSTVTDYDGNVYDVVEIGNQCWMVENLKVTHYSDGTAIPHVTEYTDWEYLTETDKAWCYYNNSSSNGDTYGALYTWAVAMNGAASSNSNPSGVQGVCPYGWHLPSYDEWNTLEDYLIANGYNWDGSTSVDKTGKSLAATSSWTSSSTTGAVGNNQQSNNSTGFTALPGGRRHNGFYNIGQVGIWWSSTNTSSTHAYPRHLQYDDIDLGIFGFDGSVDNGFSVRCVRD